MLKRLTDAGWTLRPPSLLAEMSFGLFLWHVYFIQVLNNYCFLAAMHYNATIDTDEVVQEVRQWLDRSDLGHAFMQCEAARVFENANSGLFLTNALGANGPRPESPTAHRSLRKGLSDAAFGSNTRISDQIKGTRDE